MEEAQEERQGPIMDQKPNPGEAEKRETEISLVPSSTETPRMKERSVLKFSQDGIPGV